MFGLSAGLGERLPNGLRSGEGLHLRTLLVLCKVCRSTAVSQAGVYIQRFRQEADLRECVSAGR